RSSAEKKKGARSGNNNEKQGERDEKERMKTWTSKYTAKVMDKSREREEELWNESNLEQLYQLNMISTEEYEQRKLKLVDHITGTKINQSTKNQVHRNFSKPNEKRVLGDIEIIKEIPKWETVAKERAICHSCRIVDNKEVWTQETRTVQISPNPFDHGSLRLVIANFAVTPTHVAKIAIDPCEEWKSYFQDVAMQKHAQRFAEEFNKKGVPKKIGFLDCWVYELVDRTPSMLFR
ncbi:hypothetical protein RFI_13218, partial [Reticulomyxa filosa]